MKRSLILALMAGALAMGFNAATLAAKQCRLEQQCKWKNFKKICVWVKVCH
jgi:hypothetical protein